MDELRRGLCAYLRQQAEWEMPDLVLTSGLATALTATSCSPAPTHRARPAVPAGSRVPAAVPTAQQRAVASGRQPAPLSCLGLHADTAAGGAAGERNSKRDALKAIYLEVQKCTACALSARRKNVVFGTGNAGAEIMVIGEAPGADEDEQAQPFVGKAGQLLTRMLAAIGLDRMSDVFITNVLKCRPPDNRDPESSEEAACMPILRRQIAVIRPKVLLLLGRVAARALLGETAGVSALRGRMHTYEGIPAFVTYHPAALLRRQEYKRPAWEDLKRFAAFLTEQGIRHGDKP